MRAFVRDGRRCRKCGKLGRLEAHQEPPLWERAAGGDPFDLGGIVTLCRGCHIARHRRPVRPGEAAWRRLVGELSR